MGAVSPPVSLGLYELSTGLFHGEGSVRVEAQELVSRWVSGPLDGPKLCKMELPSTAAATWQRPAAGTPPRPSPPLSTSPSICLYAGYTGRNPMSSLGGLGPGHRSSSSMTREGS